MTRRSLHVFIRS